MAKLINISEVSKIVNLIDPITKKPLEVRQGKGKGNVEYYVAPIKPGKILYEMEGVDEALAREAFALAAAKLPVATKFIARKSV